MKNIDTRFKEKLFQGIDVDYFGRVYFLVLQVFRKLTVDIGIFNILEEITINDVESLNI